MAYNPFNPLTLTTYPTPDKVESPHFFFILFFFLSEWPHRMLRDYFYAQITFFSVLERPETRLNDGLKSLWLVLILTTCNRNVIFVFYKRSLVKVCYSGLFGLYFTGNLSWAKLWRDCDVIHGIFILFWYLRKDEMHILVANIKVLGVW